MKFSGVIVVDGCSLDWGVEPAEAVGRYFVEVWKYEPFRPDYSETALVGEQTSVLELELMLHRMGKRMVDRMVADGYGPQEAEK